MTLIKEEFLKSIESKLENIKIDDAKKVIYELSNKLEDSKYEMTLCIIDNIMGVERNKDILLKEVEELRKLYKKIKNGKICINCYAEGSSYSPFGEEYDYVYYPSVDLNEVLNKTYELGRNLIYNKEYGLAIKIYDLMLFSNYTCEEVGNPLI